MKQIRSRLLEFESLVIRMDWPGTTVVTDVVVNCAVLWQVVGDVRWRVDMNMGASKRGIADRIEELRVI